jgi:hypothetical protein
MYTPQLVHPDYEVPMRALEDLWAGYDGIGWVAAPCCAWPPVWGDVWGDRARIVAGIRVSYFG